MIHPIKTNIIFIIKFKLQVGSINEFGMLEISINYIKFCNNIYKYSM